MHRRDALSLMSAVTAHALFASVVAEAAETAAAIDATGEAWVPKWIPKERAPMLEALVDTFLPGDRYAGAKQARVPVLRRPALRDCYTADEQRIFTTGLEALAADTAKTHGRPFEACSPEERHALLARSTRRATSPTPGPAARSCASSRT
jgi:hypothetical protein